MWVRIPAKNLQRYDVLRAQPSTIIEDVRHEGEVVTVNLRDEAHGFTVGTATYYEFDSVSIQKREER